jgi:nucleoside-diphosphate-sugar epimerase
MKDWKGVRVLITGAAGFIGSHLAERLVREGARVRALDDFSTGRRENLEGIAGLELLEGDIRDPGLVAEACRGVEIVFHQAALGSIPRSMKDPRTTLDVNVLGTVCVLAAARDAGVSRTVYASSSSVYGDSPEQPRREGREGRPVSPYAASKRINEELAEVFERCFGMSTIGLRYFNIYGPRQNPDGPYAAVVPRFFLACRKGEAPVIYGDGSQSRDFTFVEDAVAANLLAAEAPSGRGGAVFNVAGGRETSVAELAERIREIAGSGQAPRHEPARAGDVPASRADLEKARAGIGYEPRVGLAEGLVKTWEYYASLEPSPARASAGGAA